MATRSLGQLTLDLVARIGGFEQPLDRAQRSSKKSMQAIQKDGKAAAAGLAKVTAAAAAAAAGLYVYTKAGMDTIDAQAKLARRLDSTIGEMRGLELAAADAGIEQGKLVSAIESYNKRLGDTVNGTGEAQKAYEKLGIEASELAQMPLSDQLALVAERISQLDTAAKRSSIADRLMSGGRGMVNLFQAGGDAIRDAVGEVENLGLAISETDASTIEEANDSIARLGLVAESAQAAVAVALTPALNDMADGLYAVAKEFKAGEYDEQVELLTTMGTVASGAAGAYVTYRSAVAAATVAQWAFNAAASANPYVALVTVLGAAAGALYTYREELGLVEDQVGDARDEIDLLTGSVEDLTAAQLENKKVPLVASLVQTQIEAAKTKAELDKVSKTIEQSGQLDEFGGARPVATSEDMAQGRQLTDDLEEQQAVIKATESELSDLDKMISEFGSSSGGGGGGGGASDAQDAIKKELAALEQQVATLDMTSEEQKLYELATKGATEAQLAQAQSALELVAAHEKQEAAAKDYRSLVESLRTDEEQLNQQMLERLDTLDAVKLSTREYQEMAGRVAGAAFEDAPDYGGLDASVGGAFGELAKIDDAQEELEEWYDTQLEMLDNYRSERADLTEQWDEQERQLKQEHEDRLADIEKARQVAQFETASKLFGDMADLTKAFAGEQSATYKAMFAAEKAYSLASTLVQSYDAIAKAWNSAPFPANIPAVATTTVETGALQAAVQAVSLSGQAHDGIDAVPEDGTWNLKKGERVTTAETSQKLDRTLDQVASNTGDAPSGGMQAGAATIEQHFHVTGDMNRQQRAMLEQAAKSGAQQGYQMVLSDFKSRGPIRKTAGV